MSNTDEILSDLEKRKHDFIDEIEKWLRQAKRSEDEIMAKIKELMEKYCLPQAPIFTSL